MHLEINYKNTDSTGSCQLLCFFLWCHFYHNLWPWKLQHPPRHPHYLLTMCNLLTMVFDLPFHPRPLGDTHLTALSTTPTPVLGVSAFHLSKTVFSSHRNLWLHSCKCPPLSLTLTFHIPSAFLTPSSLLFPHHICSSLQFCPPPFLPQTSMLLLHRGSGEKTTRLPVTPLLPTGFAWFF